MQTQPGLLLFWFSFKSPWLLLVLFAVPAGAVLYVLLERHRTARAANWSSPALLGNMVMGSPGGRRYVPAVVFGIALTLLLAGFARPEAKLTQTKDGATIVLLIDTSGSMGATDVKPTRLLAADKALTTFVDQIPSRYRVALITFSTAIATRMPPTYDRQALIHALPQKAELQGTALGTAIKQAVTIAQKAVGPSKPGDPHPPATILLVSDGGTNEGTVTPVQAAKLALKAGIPVSTIALGTVTASVTHQIPLGNGKTAPEVLQVPVEPKTLQTVAKTSGGKFYPATSGSQLGQVYKDLGSRLVHSKEYREITVWVTAAALLLMLAAAGLSAWWFRRLV